jgi:hypothetical protein
VIAERGQPHGSGLGTSGMSSRERSPGCTASAACASAGNAGTTSMKPSSAHPDRASGPYSPHWQQSLANHEQNQYLTPARKRHPTPLSRVRTEPSKLGQQSGCCDPLQDGRGSG